MRRLAIAFLFGALALSAEACAPLRHLFVAAPGYACTATRAPPALRWREPPAWDCRAEASAQTR